MGIDLSFRNTGVAVIDRIKHGDSVELRPRLATVVTTKKPEKCETLDRVRREINNIKRLRMGIEEMIDKYNPDIIVIEIPHFSQSASGSYAMGICHSMVESIRDTYDLKKFGIILPKRLKDWAGSLKGDGKAAVKHKVRGYDCYSEIRNDNIIDAIGIALLWCDKLTLDEHDQEDFNNW